MKKVELLAPAGNYDKLEYALAYGADAVYLGGNSYGMRALADNFSLEEIKKAVDYAHKYNKKIYVTLNITARNHQVNKMAAYAKELYELDVDAFIISDIGVMAAIKRTVPDAKIHISTQANVTNHEAANMYHELGADRIVLARELSLEEILEIRQKTQKTLQLEVFVHGAMCISYSGRCLLSNYMASRDSNQGNCAQSCRWKYNLVEEKRPGEYYPVFEDDNGTYIFNSKDLCLIGYIDKLIEAGVDSFKIEGRMKSIFYVSSITRVYKEAIDKYYNDPLNYSEDEQWITELKKVSHRDYTAGFINGRPGLGESTIFSDNSYMRGYTFCGVIRGFDEEKRELIVEQRNNFKTGDDLEIVSPRKKYQTYHVNKMFDQYNNMIDAAPHAQMMIYLPYEGEKISGFSYLRRNDK